MPELTVDEAVARARQAQEDRIEAVRTLAETTQQLAYVRDQTAQELAELQRKIGERVSAVERDISHAYSSALKAGWTVTELRKIGYAEPAKKRRARVARRRNEQAVADAATEPAQAPATTAG